MKSEGLIVDAPESTVEGANKKNLPRFNLVKNGREKNLASRGILDPLTFIEQHVSWRKIPAMWSYMAREADRFIFSTN